MNYGLDKKKLEEEDLLRRHYYQRQVHPLLEKKRKEQNKYWEKQNIEASKKYVGATQNQHTNTSNPIKHQTSSSHTSSNYSWPSQNSHKSSDQSSDPWKNNSDNDDKIQNSYQKHIIEEKPKEKPEKKPYEKSRMYSVLHFKNGEFHLYNEKIIERLENIAKFKLEISSKNATKGNMNFRLLDVASVIFGYFFKEFQNIGKAQDWMKSICEKNSLFSTLTDDIREIRYEIGYDFCDNKELKNRVVNLLEAPKKAVDEAEWKNLECLALKITAVCGLVLGLIGAVSPIIGIGMMSLIGSVGWCYKVLTYDGYETMIKKAVVNLKIEAEDLLKTKWKYMGQFEGDENAWIAKN